jgi:hypothetical protein
MIDTGMSHIGFRCILRKGGPVEAEVARETSQEQLSRCTQIADFE